MLGEEKDGFFGNLGDEFMNDTVPFEDDAWISDEFMETQVIDNDEFLLCRETQAVDLGFGTQEEPFVEDEQLLQGFDGLATQVLDPSAEDSDGVDVTVFLVDNSEVSDCGDSSSRRKVLSSEDKSREHAPSSGHENVNPTGEFLTQSDKTLFMENITILFLASSSRFCFLFKLKVG